MPDCYIPCAARAKKAAAVFPRPAAGSLKPLVHCPSQKYNTKIRLGRGFTLEELKVSFQSVPNERLDRTMRQKTINCFKTRHCAFIKTVQRSRALLAPRHGMRLTRQHAPLSTASMQTHLRPHLRLRLRI